MISRFIPLFVLLSLLLLPNANAESENVIGHWSKLPTPKNMPTSEIFWDWDVSRYPVVDYERGIMYKLINDGGWEFWKYSIKDNTFVKIPVSNFPLNRCCYIYNPGENSIWVTYIGRGATYRLPVTGGESEYIGGSGTYSDNFNSIAYWNSCNKKFSLLFGYGGYSVKNWCWQFGIGDANWNLAQKNAAGSEPWQRTHSALTVDPSGKRIFVGMGIGNSTGRQYKLDPNFVNNGDYDYLRDLWCLHLESNTWENLIPLNTIKPLDGKLVYYPDNDALFLFNTLTSKALPGEKVGYEERAYGEYEEGVWMMRLEKDTNFIKISTKGEAPETNLGANVCYDSINKRILYMNKDSVYVFSLEEDKPQIITQPQSQTVSVGSSVTFSVTASGTGLSYQWYKGSTKISGATSDSYTIGSVKTSDAGSYKVTVSNSAGSVTSSTVTLTVNVPVVKPTITTQPKSQTVSVGSSVTFSVTATGTGLSYQWYKGSSKINGATSASYTIGSVKTSDAGSYSVTVSNSAGGVTSSTATLTVSVPVVKPTITVQPKSQTVNVGSSVTFSVTATGTGLSYQWYKGSSKINGATSASYTISSVKTSDAGSYSVTVSNSAGGVSSSVATLTVDVAMVKPTITTQPTSLMVERGDSVTFSVKATGTAPLSYQWYKGVAKINGATSASYTINSAEKSDEASYKVVVSNAAGSVSSSTAILTVNTFSVILSSISISGSSSVNVGGTATYTCIATYNNGATKTVTPIWSISSGDSYASITSDGVLTGRASGGATVKASYSDDGVTKTATQAVSITTSKTLVNLSISGSSSVNVGGTATYTCTATYSNGTSKTVTPNWSISSGDSYASITGAGVLTGKAAGTVTVKASFSGKTATQNVTISPNPSYTLSSISISGTGSVNVGSTANYTCKATYSDGTTKTVTPAWSISSGSTYASITGAGVLTGKAAGTVTVKASYSEGEETKTATKSVTVKDIMPKIITQPKSQTVNEDSSVTFSVTATGTGLSYQWYKNSTNISGATDASYTITSVKPSDAGSYTVTVSNNAGSVISDEAMLKVNAAVVKPTITTQPKSQTVPEGNSVTFSVVATGTAPLKYQWKKNGTAISDATSSSYKISSVKSSDEGSYTVTVSNSAGSVTSSVATLTMIQDPNPIVLNSITIFANGTSLTVSRTTSLICKAYYSDGTSKTVVPIWSISSGIDYASIDGEGNLTGDAAGTVEVQAKYTEGGVTKTATKIVTIVPVPGPVTQPTITIQPESQIVSEGNSVTFSVVATGTATLKYQWKKNGIDISGATSSSYKIDDVKNIDAGSYTVTVSNSAGSVTSSAATLKVNPVSNPIKISKENYGTKVTITFTGILQESSDMKTWKDVTDQSPYTTPVWRGQKFYRSVK